MGALGVLEAHHTVINIASTPATATAIGLAVARLVAEHGAESGPSSHTDPPSWLSIDVGDGADRIPEDAAFAFGAGTLAEVPVVLRCETGFRETLSVGVVTRSGDVATGEAVRDRIRSAAQELNPLRGRAITASLRGGLTFRARVDVLESMGSDKFIHFAVPADDARTDVLGDLRAGQQQAPPAGVDEIVARLSTDSNAARGAEVDLFYDPTKIAVFDAATGRNLAL